MTTDPWPGEWLRGVLDLCVLAVLAEGTTYGYAITARLDELGLGAVKGGTLYPLLVRLEQAGLVTTQWQPGVGGPGRKYFTLTPTGRSELAHRGTAWRDFAHLTVAIVDPTPTDTATTSSERPPTTTRTAP